MKRKIFAALLAVMMVVSMLPLSVMATVAEKETFKVRYRDFGDGSETRVAYGTKTVDTTTENMETLGADTFKRTGYTLTWNSSSDGKGAVSVEPGKSLDNKEIRTLIEIAEKLGWKNYITLNAKWTPNTYSINYIAGEGEYTGNLPNHGSNWLICKDAYTYDAPVKLYGGADFVREGYTLTGWEIAGTKYELGETVEKNFTYTLHGTVDAKAVWTPNTYRINYNAGEGKYTGTLPNRGDNWLIITDGYTYDAPVTLYDGADFVREGYTLTGWEIGGDVYELGATVEKNFTTAKGGTVQAAAKWTPNTNTPYTVKYLDKATGEELAEADEFTGTTDTITEVTPIEITGFTPVDDVVQQIIKGDGSTVVNVYYNRDSYDITYMVDGVEFDKQTYKFGADVTAPEDPEKEGYTFAGWVDEEGNSVKIPETMPANNVTVIATWELTEYTVVFYDPTNGNKVITTAPFTIENPEVTLPEIREENRVLYRWYDNANSCNRMPDDDNKVTFDIADANDNNEIKLGAVWGHEVIFKYNNKVVDTQIVKRGQTVTEPTGFEVQTGYYIKGWRLEDATKSYNFDTPVYDNMTLVARPAYETYTITFIIDEETKVEEYKYNEEVAPVDPTKTGYTFAGWEPALPEKMPAENLTVTATWTENTYNIKLMSDGEEYQVFENVLYTEEVPLPAAEKAGFTFIGWEAKKAPFKTYAAGETVSKLTSNNDNTTVFLYAVWSDEYTYNIKLMDGQDVVEHFAGVRYSEEVVLPGAKKAGYTFIGWESMKAPFKTYAEGETVSKLTSGNDNTTVYFYAVWEPIEYRLQFNAGKDQGTFADGNRFFNVTMTIEDGAYVLAEEPTRIGYELLGWKVGDEKVAADYAFTVAELLEIAEVSYDANGNPYFKITARWNGSDVTVEYAFTSGAKLPEEVMALLPVDENVYHEGDVITAPVIADSVDVEGGRWKFEGWSVDSYTVTAEDAESGEILILGNWRFLQKFERPKFEMPRFNFRSIVIDTTEGGKTDVSGKTVGAMGSTRKFVITPDEGFEIDEVLVNGKPVEVSKNGEISFVVTDHTHVEVYFAEIEG